MRKDGVLTYLLSDHLGSTSIVTDASGNKVSEMRYKAAHRVLREGEVRYTSGTTPTDYGFTGQYSHQSDFGLMFYNARYYDSALGRFASADTIVPGGVQGLDKYAYANNSPVVYNDPTGHCPICVLAWVAVNADAITSVAIAAFVVVASVSGANDAYQSGDINGALQNLAMLPVAGVVGTSGLSEMESKVILPEEQAPLISEESIFLRGIKKSYSIDDPEAYYLRKCLKS